MSHRQLTDCPKQILLHYLLHKCYNIHTKVSRYQTTPNWLRGRYCYTIVTIFTQSCQDATQTTHTCCSTDYLEQTNIMSVLGFGNFGPKLKDMAVWHVLGNIVTFLQQHCYTSYCFNIVTIFSHELKVPQTAGAGLLNHINCLTKYLGQVLVYLDISYNCKDDWRSGELFKQLLPILDKMPAIHVAAALPKLTGWAD